MEMLIFFFLSKSNLNHLVHSWYKWVYLILPLDIAALSAGRLETSAGNTGRAHLQNSVYVNREWNNFVYLYNQTALMYIVYASGISF